MRGFIQRLRGVDNTPAHIAPLFEAVKVTRRMCEVQGLDLPEDDVILVASTVLAAFAEHGGLDGPSRRALKAEALECLMRVMLTDEQISEIANGDASTVV